MHALIAAAWLLSLVIGLAIVVGIAALVALAVHERRDARRLVTETTDYLRTLTANR